MGYRILYCILTMYCEKIMGYWSLYCILNFYSATGYWLLESVLNFNIFCGMEPALLWKLWNRQLQTQILMVFYAVLSSSGLCTFTFWFLPLAFWYRIYWNAQVQWLVYYIVPGVTIISYQQIWLYFKIHKVSRRCCTPVSIHWSASYPLK